VINSVMGNQLIELWGETLVFRIYFPNYAIIPLWLPHKCDLVPKPKTGTTVCLKWFC